MKWTSSVFVVFIKRISTCNSQQLAIEPPHLHTKYHQMHHEPRTTHHTLLIGMASGNWAVYDFYASISPGWTGAHYAIAEQIPFQATSRAPQSVPHSGTQLIVSGYNKKLRHHILLLKFSFNLDWTHMYTFCIKCNVSFPLVSIYWQIRRCVSQNIHRNLCSIIIL